MLTNEFLIGILFGFLLPLLWAILGCDMAIKRNRGGWLWFINCFLTGLIGIITLACAPHLDYDEDSGYKESETLGWIILALGIAFFALSFWYGWEVAKERHNQMFWNFYMQIMNR